MTAFVSVMFGAVMVTSFDLMAIPPPSITTSLSPHLKVIDPLASIL